MIRLTEQEFSDVVQYIRETYGINLEKKKVLIECRMSKELERYKLDTFHAYMELIRRDQSGKVAGEMVNRLTTNYTYFLREPSHFEILKDTLLPEFYQRRQRGLLKIWCAGCATGEECYTLAMTLQDYKEKSGGGNAKITATDISGEVLKKAGEGIYPIKELESIPQAWRERYCCDIDARAFRIRESLKSNICFVRHNLLEQEDKAEKYDLILCRNVMIYFDKMSRKKLVKILEDRLNPGGYLMIGHAELLTMEDTVLRQVFPAVYKKADTQEKQREENTWKRQF